MKEKMKEKIVDIIAVLCGGIGVWIFGVRGLPYTLIQIANNDPDGYVGFGIFCILTICCMVVLVAGILHLSDRGWMH